MADHVYVERCDNPDCDSSCNLCNLTVCKVCNLYEGGLPTECPGKPSMAHANAIYEGREDFKDGKWIKLK